MRPEAFTDADIEAYREAAMQPGALTAAINYYRAAFRAPESWSGMPPGVRRAIGLLTGPVPPPHAVVPIAVPTLLIWGEGDPVLGKELTIGMEPLFSAPFEVAYIPDASHWVQQEAPHEVNRLMLGFLGNLGTRPAASVPATR
jgi:pimeloyl-ACP methyl ester carboxylesterase